MSLTFDIINFITKGLIRKQDVGGSSLGESFYSGTVATYANLPSASSHNGEYYFVDTTTDDGLANIFRPTRFSGTYKSNGSTWDYKGNDPRFLSLKVGSDIVTSTEIEIVSANDGLSLTPDATEGKITFTSLFDSIIKTAYDNAVTALFDLLERTINGKPLTDNITLTTADIEDSTNSRYLSDTQKTEATRNANTSQNGLLSSTDWDTFNNKDESTLIFSAYAGSAQSLATATTTTIHIDTSEVDIYSKFNSSTYTYTIPTTGVYHISASIAYDSSSNGSRYAFISKNGTNTRYRVILGAPSTSSVIIPSISVELALNANDTIQLIGYQNSGGSVALSIGATGNSTFIEIYKK